MLVKGATIDQIESRFEIDKTNKKWTAVSFGFVNEAFEDEYAVCRPCILFKSLLIWVIDIQTSFGKA